MVATAWATARRREGETGIFDWGALLVALATGVGMVTYGLETANNPAGSKGGDPAVMYFFLGAVTLLAAAGDVRMLVRGGVSGVSRITRHLWRMCFGLFMATASIFLARPHLFPAILSKMNVLSFLGVLPLILMIFWLFRVRFSNAYKRKSMPRAVQVSA
jgi:hypothetical protein